MSWFVGSVVESDSSAAQWTVTLYVSTALFMTSALALWLKYSSNAKNGSHYGDKGGRANGTANGDAEPPKTVVSVLFGTQTGTAERFANQLSEEITEKYGKSGVAARALDVETYDHKTKLVKEDLAIFCVATYGDGEPTDSALSFTEWLEKLVKKSDTDGSEPLKDLRYGVFALGNKQYEHFCACGKLVDKQLKALGANKIIERGEGDDDANIEDDFAAWKEMLWVELDALEGFKAEKANGYANGHHVPITPIVPVKEEYDVEEVKSSSSVADPWAHGSQAATATTPLKAMVMERKELHTKASERSCIHAEIDISGTGITYDTGDHVGVYASNPPELVSLALKRLGYDGKKVVKLSTKLGSKLPNSMFEGKALAIRDILSHFLDLQSPPRKDSLAAMADCAKDPKEKQRLEYLVSKVVKEEYRTYVLDDLRSLLEIMEDFPSVQPSLGVFAARIAPKLQPRFYSISSSPLVHPNRIHITCSVVEGKSPTGRDHKGVAGTWFSRCNQGVSQVAIFVRKSNFKLPKAVETPLILVGPGTGFAPFRGFLQERTAQVSMGESKHGECHLYFGCRNKSKDFIYEDEIQSFKEKSVISHLEIAFSRDQARKVYVQDKLKKNGKVIYDLLFGECDPQATLYVCGDAKAMARDVNKALHEIIQYYGSHSSGEAELMIKNLQQGGRYLRDIW